MKKPSRLVHDATITHEILETIKQIPVFPMLNDFYPEQTTNLLKQLKLLETSQKANHIPSILRELNIYINNCGNFMQLPDKNKQEIGSYLGSIEKNLTDIISNICVFKKRVETEITITCALDGYTLNRTSALIDSLNALIDEPTLTTTSERQEIRRIVTGFFASNRKCQIGHSLADIVIAKQLKEICMMIQSQIGSSETMPKGLLIDYMMHLHQALLHCEKSNTKLLNCINHEITHIQSAYPELARAGEELQKAIANYQPQKP